MEEVWGPIQTDIAEVASGLSLLAHPFKPATRRWNDKRAVLSRAVVESAFNATQQRASFALCVCEAQRE